MASPLADGAVNLLALGEFRNPNLDSEVVLNTDPDGGGIRGVSELLILHEMMRRVQHDLKLAQLPRPCDYFHLIGGTSTGG